MSSEFKPDNAGVQTSSTSQGPAMPLDERRWSDVKAIFELAVTLDSSEWSSFLDVRCGGDEELRREVESLLLAHDSSSDFLEEPVTFVKQLVDLEATGRPEAPRAGTRIGPYELEKEIGRGGMGTVYLANRVDEEFEQRVAIKLVRVEKHSEFTVRRFRQERQILARLEHPYIARLIDGGTTESGTPYFVMEHVDGEQLTQFCDSHALPAGDRVQLFLKVCAAVRYAHDRNIIHRDLKPGNVLVKKDGTPKLLDFGIAKLLESEGNKEATVAGFRMLTPAYASPEQMRGDPATAQSDVYSLGVMLYELLCGERPSLRTMQNNGASDSGRASHLSPQLRAIVFNAIRLDPDERYQSVALFAEDVQRYLDGAPLMAAVSSNTEAITIGILPFRELNQDSAADPFLRSALTDALITRLSRVERLSVRPTSAVLKYAQRGDTAKAARELRVQYILEGTLHTAGDQIRLNVQLVSAYSGSAIWAAHFDEDAHELLTLEDSISEQIAGALIPHLTGEERSQLARAGTSSGAAHEAYLRGRFHWSRSAGEADELAKALVYFSRAIAEDPNYARAHAGVADYYLRLGLWGGVPPAESFAAGIDAAKRALDLDPTLAEAHATLGFCVWAFQRDYATAERHFHLSIAHNPEYASAHHWFGLLNSASNRPDLALANLERARKIDPNSPVIAAALGFVHYNARRYPQSLDLLLEASRDLRNSAVLQEMLTWTYLQLGEVRKALDCAMRAVELGHRSPAALAALARAEAAAGNVSAAQVICRELRASRGSRYVSGYDLASAAVAAGDPAEALKELEGACSERDWWICWLGVDPRWDPLRTHRGFDSLIRQAQPFRADAPQGRRSVRRDPLGWAILAGSLALGLAGAIFSWNQHASRSAPFANPHFSKLTGDGTAQIAEISPDGHWVAYAASKSGKTYLWRREVGKSVSSPICPAVGGEITGLHFTADGSRVAFESYPTLQPFSRHLYSVPLMGGSLQQLLGKLTGPATVSPHGTQVALIRANKQLGRDELWISNLRDGTERLLTSRAYPERLAGETPPEWSSDEKLIAFAVEERDAQGFLVGVHSAEVKTGRAHRLVTPRLLWVEHLAWVRGHTGLAVVGREQESSFRQLWYVSYPNGPAKRLGNDIDSYVGVSVSEDGKRLVSVQLQTLSNIYLLKPGAGASPVQITPGTGRYFDLTWNGENGILYASDSTGSADIWAMNADGSEQHQLTGGSGLTWAPAMSPDGRYMAYHTNRNGSWNIWRADVDGTNPKRLTEGSHDSNWPHFGPDGKFVFFHRTDLRGAWNIWKVPVEGGDAVQVTSVMTMHPAVSMRDGRIAAWYSEGSASQTWKLAIFSSDGAGPLQTFSPAMPVSPDSQLAWTPAGDGITFIGQRDGVWNLWTQPLNGGPARPLTALKSGQIYSFDWSRQGKLAFSHGMTTSDVVIVGDEKAR